MYVYTKIAALIKHVHTNVDIVIINYFMYVITNSLLFAASNTIIRMNCKCNTLYCDCSSKFKVKLGDFDSAETITG